MDRAAAVVEHRIILDRKGGDVKEYQLQRTKKVTRMTVMIVTMQIGSIQTMTSTRMMMICFWSGLMRSLKILKKKEGKRAWH